MTFWPKAARLCVLFITGIAIACLGMGALSAQTPSSQTSSSSSKPSSGRLHGQVIDPSRGGHPQCRYHFEESKSGKLFPPSLMALVLTW